MGETLREGSRRRMETTEGLRRGEKARRSNREARDGGRSRQRGGRSCPCHRVEGDLLCESEEETESGSRRGIGMRLGPVPRRF